MVKVINPTTSKTTQITHKFILGVHREVCPDKLLGEQTRRLLRACASEYLDQIFESACEMCLFSGMGLLQPKHLQMAVRLEESRAEAVREFVRAIKESAGAEEGDSLQALLLLDEETVPEVVKNLSLRRRGVKTGSQLIGDRPVLDGGEEGALPSVPLLLSAHKALPLNPQTLRAQVHQMRTHPLRSQSPFEYVGMFPTKHIVKIVPRDQVSKERGTGESSPTLSGGGHHWLRSDLRLTSGS